MEDKKVTLKQAKAILRPLGMTLNRTQWGDYRVGFASLSGKAANDAALYTDDLQDALASGQHMAAMEQGNE